MSDRERADMLSAHIATLEAENKELRKALDDIAGGFGSKTHPLPSMELGQGEFVHAMWTWSQKRARVAREANE